MRFRRLTSPLAVTTFTVLSTVLLCVPASAMGADAPVSTPVERVHPVVQPAIVYEQITFSSKVYDRRNETFLNNGKPFVFESKCSGFFVTPDGHVATAGHCVVWDDRRRDGFLDAAAAWAVDNNYYAPARPSLKTVRAAAGQFYELRERQREMLVKYGIALSGETTTARPVTARLMAGRAPRSGDVALLKIEASDLPAIELAPADTVAVGKPIVAIGFPQIVDDITDADRFNPSFKDGSISSVKTIEGGRVQVYEMSAALTFGMSGGPTVDHEGRVLGINSVRPNPASETQQFNFVSPAKYLAEILGDKDVRNDIGETNRRYQTGLDAYFAGEKNKAIEEFEAVLSDNRSHELAQDYLERAQGLPDQDGGFPWWGIVLIVLGGVLLIGGLLYALMRSGRLGRREPAAPAPISDAPMPERGRTVISTRPSTGEPTLVIREGPGAGQRFAIKQDTLVGREDADVILDDAEVSRRHALIKSVNGKYEISDLRSANGTMVNGSPVEGVQYLTDGDVIELGRTKLGVELPSDRGGTATGHRREES